jgi:NADP-dependent 3-hydroxy acid dehydrogenase YdfG
MPPSERLVNNAGSAAGGVIEHLTEDDWEKGLQLKFMELKQLGSSSLGPNLIPLGYQRCYSAQFCICISSIKAQLP